MQLDKKKISHRQFSLSGFSEKFRISKTKKGVCDALQKFGGTVLERGGSCLIGNKTQSFYTRYSNSDYVFEGELEDRSYQKDYKYFKDYDLRFYDMVRKLLSTDNIDITYLNLGEPVNKGDFEKFEKKLKIKIPRAVKEFYSLFGEVRILWTHSRPYTKKSRYASNKVWNMDFHDNHVGSFQILPLKTVLFEKWSDEKYGFGVGEDLKIFDTSTESNIVALDITNSENPMVYLGNDHGVSFEDNSPMLLTEYLDLCVGLYGMRDRMSYFQHKHAPNKSEKEVEKAIKGQLSVDINNDVFIVPQINQFVPLIEEAITNEDYDQAKKHVFKIYDLKNLLGIKYLLDIDRLQHDAKSFTRRMNQGVRQSDFDLIGYENQNILDPIFESRLYIKMRDKLNLDDGPKINAT